MTSHTQAVKPWPVIGFDEGPHVYTLDGAEVPSVTQVIQAAGLADFSFVDEFYRERGSRAHKAVHLALAGELDLASCSDDVVGYVIAAAKFLEDLKASTIAAEARVCSPTLRYAGTLDWLGTFGMDGAATVAGITPGVLTLVDWKTSRSFHPATAIQTAAYRDALQEETGQLAQQRMCVLLADDGTYRYTVYRGMDHRRDGEVFRAALVTTAWKKEHHI